MEDLCASCMCNDRDLTYLVDEFLLNIYQSILNEIQAELPPRVRLCALCVCALQQFHSFKQQAQDAYRHLHIYEPKPKLAKPAQLQTALNVVHNSIPDHPVKMEPTVETDVLGNQPTVQVDGLENQPALEVSILENDSASGIKTEEVEVASDHVEETFVNDYVPDVEVKVKKKKTKKKLRKKRKISTDSEDNEPLAGAQDNGDISEDIPRDTCEDIPQDGPNMGMSIDHKEEPEEGISITEETCPNIIKHTILTPQEVETERQNLMCSEDYVKSVYKCDQCVTAFKSKAVMKKHYDEIHSELAGAHACATCAARFGTAALLAAHAHTHTSRYTCQVCQLQDSDEALMLRHAREHAEYKCTLCGHQSKSWALHQAHLSAAHGARPLCAQCGRVFSSRKTYRYHVNVLHKGQNRFPCPHCGKVYQWKSNLWRHIKNHKARETGELYCAPCDKKFSSVATYRQHCKTSRRHVDADQFNFICNSCGARFVSRAKLKEHVDWEHLQLTRHRCHLCQKPFKSSTSLYVHVQNVHRSKDDKDNLCHVCGKSYQSSAKLKYHIVAMHTSATPYACSACPAAFSWYSSLYRHVRELHHKIKVSKKPKKAKQPEAAGAPQGEPPGAGAPRTAPVMGPAPHRLRDLL